MAQCPHCGAERPLVGYGVSHPKYGDCPNGCMERERQQQRAESEAFSRRVQDQQAICSHEWRTRIQSGYGYEQCIKCDKTRPVGGGSW